MSFRQKNIKDNLLTPIGITRNEGYQYIVPRVYFPLNIVPLKLEDGTQAARIKAGTVNGVFPLFLGSTPIDTEHWVTITGTKYFALLLEIDIDPESETYRDVLSAFIQVYSARNDVPLSTPQYPSLILGRIKVVDNAVTELINEVYGSLQVVLFYDQVVFVPLASATNIV